MTLEDFYNSNNTEELEIPENTECKSTLVMGNGIDDNVTITCESDTNGMEVHTVHQDKDGMVSESFVAFDMNTGKLTSGSINRDTNEKQDESSVNLNDLLKDLNDLFAKYEKALNLV